MRALDSDLLHSSRSPVDPWLSCGAPHSDVWHEQRAHAIAMLRRRLEARMRGASATDLNAMASFMIASLSIF